MLLKSLRFSTSKHGSIIRKQCIVKCKTVSKTERVTGIQSVTTHGDQECGSPCRVFDVSMLGRSVPALSLRNKG